MLYQNIEYHNNKMKKRKITGVILAHKEIMIKDRE